MFFSRPHGQSGYSRPVNGATSRPTVNLHVKPNDSLSSSKRPTQPPRQSIRPMSTDSFSPINSISGGPFTKPGWQATTEPGFITSLNHNSIHSGSKPNVLQWQVTTEPGFVTRIKTKPSSNKPKAPKPSKKPLQVTTSKSTVKFSTKSSRPTTTSRCFH